jgi:hypothetical protein
MLENSNINDWKILPISTDFILQFLFTFFTHVPDMGDTIFLRGMFSDELNILSFY